MNTVRYKCIELLVLFVLIPLSFVMPFNIRVKLLIGGLGFLYVTFVLLKIEKLEFKVSPNLNWAKFWKRVLLQFLVIVIVTMLYVSFVDSSQLFVVLRTKPLLFVSILGVYTVFSVYPQELIYRTFFFQRYCPLFPNKKLFIFFNAVLFSLAHLFFNNVLVSVITGIGGVLFAYTFFKTKSTLQVSIEHAIYGCWLFTVGMGNMLGFPS